MAKSDDQDRNDSGRRKVLKATVAAGVATSAILLPKSWTKPILRSIIVPAHAQTTVASSTTTGTTTTGTTTATTTTPLPGSDRRVKRDVRLLAMLDNGIKLYRFKYLWSDTEFVGVMAQDLLAQDEFSSAAIMTDTGFYVVDYAQIGVRMATLEAWQDAGLDAIRLNAPVETQSEAAALPMLST